MFVKVLLIASMIITGVIFACGNQHNLTGPEKEIVGTWRLVEGAVDGNIVFNVFNVPIRSEIRFNSDGTWQDDDGGKGTWQLRSNQVVTNEISYYHEGDELTVLVTKAEALSRLSGNTELIVWLDQFLEPNDGVILIYKKTV